MSEKKLLLSPETQKVMEELPVAVAVYQYIDGKVEALFFSDRFLQMFGFHTVDEVVQAMKTDMYQDTHPDDVARMADLADRFANDESGYDVVFRSKSRNRQDFHIIHAVGKHFCIHGTELAAVTYIDETETLQKRSKTEYNLEKSLSGNIRVDVEQHRNQYDDLTGLPSLNHFFQKADTTFREIRGEGDAPAVLWMEFNGLDEFSDTYGFVMGERLIREFGNLIRRRIGTEHAARASTNQFVALVPWDGSDDSIRDLFHEVRSLNHGRTLSLRVGIEPDLSGAEELAGAIDRAKLACSSLTERVHSAYAIYNEEISRAAEIQRHVLTNFDRALEEGWIQVYFQPVVRSITGEICGAEALCRWIDPEHGMISPGSFIPALENNGQIYRLDLYMIEQVCRSCQQLINAGRHVVPVSVNLSRKDFLHPDIVSRIEELALRYQMPRELINIEITESAFSKHADQLQYYIGLFHELGYQVWMDDFGTAYSSLGALKDLSFDEMKIDMSFLSRTSEKARKIIKAVVRMAKEIGIQTLAEGVETKEQYEFLRDIGCEKIQGYYFGRPMPSGQFDQFCSDNRMQLEALRWKPYYDRLSRLDYQTEEPLCVIEDDGTRMRSLYMNAAYRDALRDDGTYDAKTWMSKINTPGTAAYKFCRRFAEESLQKSSAGQSFAQQTVMLPSGDHYLQLSGRTAAHYQDHYIYTMQVSCIRLQTKMQANDEYLKNLFYICNDIAVIDLSRNVMYGLKSDNSAQPIGVGGKEVDLNEAVRSWVSDFVYPLDQTRAKEFLDPDTMRRRLGESSGQRLITLLRSRMTNGSYQWILNVLLSLPKTDGNQVLDATISTQMDEQFLRLILHEDYQRGLGEDQESENSEGITNAVLWKNQAVYGDEKCFWKDSERRFVGASQSFLDYYGFKSVEEILGKTDEDMHWHVAAEPFRTDELNVLRNGTRVSQKIGSCIARGELHTILASKIPVYRDGRIIGLMGKFTDRDEILSFAGELEQRDFVDEVTGLSGVSGIENNFRKYLGELWNNGKEFYMMRVSVPEFRVFYETYGLEAAKALLARIGELLVGVIGREGTIGRIAGAHFVLFIQNLSRDEIVQLSDDIRTRISSLRKVDDWNFAGTAEIRTTLMNKQNAGRDRYADAVYNMMAGFSNT